MPALNEKAMLVHLRVRAWTGTRKNDHVTRENCKRYEAEEDAGVWLTNFIPSQDKSKLISAAAKLRNEWRKQTLPWLDESIRILPSDLFMEYRKRMSEAKSEYEQVTNSFISRFPKICERMPNRLKGLLDKHKLPTIGELKHKFAVTLNVFPLPTTTDFRIGNSAEEREEIKKQVEATMQEAASRMMGNVWGQLTQLVGKIEERLSSPDKKFHDTLITNLIDFCIDLPKWNLTDDEELEKIRKEVIAKLCVLKPDNLRQDKADRREAAKKAKELVKKMKAYAL